MPMCSYFFHETWVREPTWDEDDKRAKEQKEQRKRTHQTFHPWSQLDNQIACMEKVITQKSFPNPTMWLPRANVLPIFLISLSLLPCSLWSHSVFSPCSKLRVLKHHSVLPPSSRLFLFLPSLCPFHLRWLLPVSSCSLSSVSFHSSFIVAPFSSGFNPCNFTFTCIKNPVYDSSSPSSFAVVCGKLCCFVTLGPP